jgi:hypothetical protein
MSSEFILFLHKIGGFGYGISIVIGIITIATIAVFIDIKERDKQYRGSGDAGALFCMLIGFIVTIACLIIWGILQHMAGPDPFVIEDNKKFEVKLHELKISYKLDNSASLNELHIANECEKQELKKILIVGSLISKFDFNQVKEKCYENQMQSSKEKELANKQWQVLSEH